MTTFNPRPCPIRLNGCPGADSPVSNFSSEAPDPMLFAGVGWPNFDSHAPTPLGNGPNVRVDCSDITWSEVSQELADLFAQLAAQYCTPPIPPGIPSVPPIPAPVEETTPDFAWTPPQWTPPTQHLQQFTNHYVEASSTCPNGTVFKQSLSAGTVISPPMDPAIGPSWVAYIDAYLQAYLWQSVSAAYSANCMVVPGIVNRLPPVGDPPAGWPSGCPWPPTNASCYPAGYTPPTGYPPPPADSNSVIANFPGWGCLGNALNLGDYTYQVGGTDDWVFTIDGNPPPGTSLITLGPRSAALAGTPTLAGTYSWTIIATLGNQTTEVVDVLHVFGLTNGSTLSDGTVGLPYSEQLQAAGGMAPYNFTQLSGSLPAGLTLAVDGTLSGMPTIAGTSSFSVKLADADGIVCYQDVTITIDSPPPPPVVGSFANTIWGPVVINNGSPVGSFAGAAFSGLSTSAGPPNGSNAYCIGTLAYAGPGFNANLNITVAASTTSLYLFDAGMVVDVYYGINPVLVIEIGEKSGFSTYAPGTYNFPFVVPAMSGILTITIVWFAGTNVDTGSMTGDGTFTP